MNNIYRYTIIIFFLSCLIGCQVDFQRNPIEKNGKLYGQTKGLFREKWWNYYKRGISFMDGECWKEAEADFKEALKQRDKDQKNTLTFGWHILDYFPHRELGISLFHQEKYQESIKELNLSLSSVTTAKAEFYLDRVRKLWIEKKNLDIKPPVVRIKSPENEFITNKLSLSISGVVYDDTFVKELTVNSNPIRIDLGLREISFNVELPLQSGENVIIIKAKDLSGKVNKSKLIVICDRTGPVLNIDGLEPKNDQNEEYILKGYAHDASGIETVYVNGQALSILPESEIVLQHDVLLLRHQKHAEIIIYDKLGNWTRAEISPNKNKHIKKLTPLESVLVASRNILPIHLTSSFPKKQATSFPPQSNMLKKTTHHDNFFLSYRGNLSKEQIQEQKQDRYKILGNNYALIIGINEYDESEKWSRLKTAVNDAVELKNILLRRYDFLKVVLRTDQQAKHKTLIQDLRTLASGLKETDNLLIYFAGHGKLDKTTQDGYWIPVDGKKNDKSTWITNSVIRKILCSSKIKGKNILVIADACYSGTLLRGGIFGNSKDDFPEDNDLLSFQGTHARGEQPSPSTTYNDYQKKVFSMGLRKSRQVISSGGIERVDDQGFKNHSFFAYYLLKALEENNHKIIDIKILFYSKVWMPIVKKGRQRPDMRPYNTPLHKDGQFIFVLKSEVLNENQIAHKRMPSASNDYRDIFSEDTVNFSDTTPPVVEVRGHKEKRPVLLDRWFLEIHVHDDSGIQYVKINDTKVMKRPGRELYINHIIPLGKEGDNSFLIECSDQVGNLTKKEVVIHRKFKKIYQPGSRMKIVQMPLSIKGSQGLGLYHILMGYLVESKRFNLYKGNFLQVSQNVADSFDKDTIFADAVDVAQDTGAEFALTATVVSKKRALEIYGYLIEAETEQIVTEQDVYGESDGDGGNIDMDLIRKLCEGLVLKFRDALPLVEGKIVRIKDKIALINRGELNYIKKGMHLVFFEEQPPVIDPDTQELLGRDVNILGTGRIQQLQEKMADTEIFNPKITKLKVGHKIITK